MSRTITKTGFSGSGIGYIQRSMHHTRPEMITRVRTNTKIDLRSNAKYVNANSCPTRPYWVQWCT
jgi:hypothetical protein